MAELTSLDALAAALGGDASFPMGAMSSPDGAVTLLVTDIEGCPAIVERLGADRAAELLRDHRIVVEAVARRYDGEVVKVEQDAVMISFASSHAALRCAIDLQRTVSELKVEPVGRLPLRAGLHSGFVISSGEAVFGRNVVIATRITAQAGPGEILVSAAVREYTESDPSFRFAPRGAVHFRGVHGEHEIYGVDWGGPPP
jgi:class 3 adenylate cyclase